MSDSGISTHEKYRQKAVLHKNIVACLATYITFILEKIAGFPRQCATRRAKKMFRKPDLRIELNTGTLTKNLFDHFLLRVNNSLLAGQW